MKFDLQLFGGGQTSTTTYQSRPLTEDETRLMHTYADYAENIQPSAYNLYNTATSQLTGGNTVNPNYQSLYNQQAAGTAANATAAQNLANGQLSQAFIDNRNAQAQDYAKTSVGNLLGDLSKRGVINSSQFDSGMDNINSNLAKAFTNSYTNDLNTSQGLLNNYQNYVNAPIQAANQAQQASYQMPLALYGAATGQMSPTANIYNQATASQNQSGTQTTSTSGGGGIFGGLLTGAATGFGGSLWK